MALGRTQRAGTFPCTRCTLRYSFIPSPAPWYLLQLSLPNEAMASEGSPIPFTVRANKPDHTRIN
jgi:hypothetical protein